ncbi:MAG TPA: hypothetical protein VGF75_06980, partial [Candidatus Saccharimonadales bacterium]
NSSPAFHLGNIILHAANVGLLFCVSIRLLVMECNKQATTAISSKFCLQAAIIALLFAVHPLGVESVSEVSYSSSLLVVTFTLLALFLAIRKVDSKAFMIADAAIVLCCFAATASKESGIAACIILVAYWGLFRRTDSARRWLILCISSFIVVGLFLAARFILAPQNTEEPPYIGGSLWNVLQEPLHFAPFEIIPNQAHCEPVHIPGRL